jgi:anti-sigma factor RsiW
MHILLRENLEGYLSGKLDPAARQELETHLAACPGCREEWEILRSSAEDIRALRPPQGMDLDPAPGFYARVMESIDTQRGVPFWAMLLDPAFGRRLAFASLMMLALLGAYVAAFDQTDYSSQHLPEAILAGQVPGVPLSRAPHFNSNLAHNRSAVLASLVTEGD